MQSKNTEYLPAIDQIRGLAALLILFYHGLTFISYQMIHQKPFSLDHWLVADTPITAILIEGHAAVSLFMVLSGYIFTIGTYRHEVVYKLFIGNRVLRTYPLFITLLIVGISSHPSSFDFSGLLQTVFFMGNYPGAISAGKFTSMFWAVAVEWQFYLLFPFLLIFTNKYGVKYLAGCIAIVLLLRGASYLQGADIQTISYLTILGRLDQFLIGIILGVLYLKYFKQGAIADLVFLISAISIATSLYYLNAIGGWPAKTYLKIFWPTIEAFIWAAFIFGYLSFSRYLPRLLARSLSSVGVISYSVYLIHVVIIDLCIKHGLVLDFFESRHLYNSIITTALVVAPVTLALSVLTYFFIEKPFLEMRFKYKKERGNP